MSPSPISVRHWTATYALGRARPRVEVARAALEALEVAETPGEVLEALRVVQASVHALDLVLDRLLTLADHAIAEEVAHVGE